MRRKSAPAERQRGSLIRRIDTASAWINPFLMAIATMLFIIDLSCGVAVFVARLPITHIAPPPAAQELPPAAQELPPAAQELPPGTVSMAVQ